MKINNVKVVLSVAAGLAIGVAVLLTVPAGPVRSQQEVASEIYRFRERVTTGYYEGYEVSPRRARATVKDTRDRPDPRGLALGSASAMVRVRALLPDSHSGLKFFHRNTCIECHPQQSRNLHSTRAGITCRQCHGPEPIPGVRSYHAAMNPIRRHAFVCAKCHEGATDAFAEFFVHEPPSMSASARKIFPIFYYTSWGMLVLLVVTMGFFLTHSLMVGFREVCDVGRVLGSIRKGAGGANRSAVRVLRNIFKKRVPVRSEVNDASEKI